MRYSTSRGITPRRSVWIAILFVVRGAVSSHWRVRAVGLTLCTVIFGFGLFVFLLAAPAFADFTYQRAPSGPEISGSFSIFIDHGNYQFDLGCDPQDEPFWTIDIVGTNGVVNTILNDVQSASTQSHTFYVSLPAGTYSAVRSACSSNADPGMWSYGGGNILEGAFGVPLFTVRSPFISGGEAISYPPEVTKLTSPKTGAVYTGDITITYDTFDRDDATNPASGIGIDAVYIDYAEDVLNAPWIRIVNRQPPKGSYLWKTDDLQEGKPYRLRLTVMDQSGKAGDQKVGPFTIDRTPPLFDVSTEPVISKGENVQIIVTATEPLHAAPLVTVQQRGLTPVSLKMTGEGAQWTGEYVVRKDVEGAARIVVKGEDLAGNSGSVLRSGGIFSVGANPPPTPIIITPLDGEILTTTEVTVRGRVREDTLAVLFLNGERIGDAQPDADGMFVFEDITLSETFNRGTNIIQVTSEDIVGRVSEAASMSVKANALPTIEIAEPQNNAILSGRPSVKLLAKDRNSDALTFLIEFSADHGLTWQVLTKNLTSVSYVWDTTEYADGEYLLRVTADDGFAKVMATAGPLRLQNFGPTIRFVFVPPFRTNRDTFHVAGTAETIVGTGLRFNVASVTFSSDGGTTWSDVTAADGKFDTELENFSFDLASLHEGSQEVIVRAVDTKKRTRKTRFFVIVDTGPPSAPIVRSPEGGAIFGAIEDSDPSRAGVQVVVEGRSEPTSTVTAAIGDAVFTGETNAAGIFSLTVTLRAHGENTVKLSAVDVAGNRSVGETTLVLNANNPPNIRFLRPRTGAAISGVFDIISEVQDSDFDAIKTVQFSFRRAGEERITVLARNAAAASFSWDTRRLPDGAYEFIIDAADGVSSGFTALPVVIDNTKPVAIAAPLAKTLFAKAFVLEMTGNAKDNLSGIETIEYTIDSADWFKATVTSGYREKAVAFRLRHPFELNDGDYTVRFRATDVSGNVSEPTSPQTFTVDTTPPRIGSFTFTVGNLAFYPEDKAFRVLAGHTVRVALSIERDAVKASLRYGDVRLEFSARSGLWETALEFPRQGEYPLAVTAEDRAGNAATDIAIGTVRVVGPGRTQTADGRPLADARVAVFQIDPADGSRRLWDAAAWNLENPVTTASDGTYAILLPSGTYDVELTKTGFQRVRISRLEVVNPRFLTLSVVMNPQPTIRDFWKSFSKPFR